MISPRYQMKLIREVNDAIWKEFESPEQVRYYIDKWHQKNDNPYDFNDGYWENFSIIENKDKRIDLVATLNSMDGRTLLQIAVDLSVDTPDFIPSIPTFKNEIKSDYSTAYDSFQKAYKLIERDPGLAVTLANAALEIVIKEILRDERISRNLNGSETLSKLASKILKEFNLTNSDHSKAVRTIANSLLSLSQAIETLRSEMTNFHEKTSNEYQVTDRIFACLMINAVATVGLFLSSYYKDQYLKQEGELSHDDLFDLPF